MYLATIIAARETIFLQNFLSIEIIQNEFREVDKFC